MAPPAPETQQKRHFSHKIVLNCNSLLKIAESGWQPKATRDRQRKHLMLKG
jgi:hypothetical protein